MKGIGRYKEHMLLSRVLRKEKKIIYELKKNMIPKTKMRGIKFYFYRGTKKRDTKIRSFEN